MGALGRRRTARAGPLGAGPATSWPPWGTGAGGRVGFEFCLADNNQLDSRSTVPLRGLNSALPLEPGREIGRDNRTLVCWPLADVDVRSASSQRMRWRPPQPPPPRQQQARPGPFKVPRLNPFWRWAHSAPPPPALGPARRAAHERPPSDHLWSRAAPGCLQWPRQVASKLQLVDGRLGYWRAPDNGQ